MSLAGTWTGVQPPPVSPKNTITLSGERTATSMRPSRSKSPALTSLPQLPTVPMRWPAPRRTGEGIAGGARVLEPDHIVGAVPIGYRDVQIAVAVQIGQCAVRGELHRRHRDLGLPPCRPLVPDQLLLGAAADYQIRKTVAVDVAGHLAVTGIGGIDDRLVEPPRLPGGGPQRSQQGKSGDAKSGGPARHPFTDQRHKANPLAA